jgi:hypothetical protein
MPSFASLRDPRRRTAVDLLVPTAPPEPERRPAPAPRPPEWSDLWLLGRHVTRVLLGVPGRCVRRLIGGDDPR